MTTFPTGAPVWLAWWINRSAKARRKRPEPNCNTVSGSALMRPHYGAGPVCPPGERVAAAGGRGYEGEPEMLWPQREAQQRSRRRRHHVGRRPVSHGLGVLSEEVGVGREDHREDGADGRRDPEQDRRPAPVERPQQHCGPED